jgi:omega-6 fatty acid desaturase (delta-12 desaturase)
MNDANRNATQVKTINEIELFMKYKSSYTSAFIDFSIHAVLMFSSFYSLWYFRESLLSVFTIPLLAFMITRTFSIFHDCGHNSYTPNKTLNYIIGSLCGVLTHHSFTWNYQHNNHHLTNGNKNNNLHHKYNEFVFHTLHQYKQFPQIVCYIYKTLRTPYIFYPIFGVYYIIFHHKISILIYKLLKIKSYKQKFRIIIFDFLLNLLVTAYWLSYIYNNEILYHLIIAYYIFFMYTMIVFNNQHTFNPSYVVNTETWNFKDSGLVGSSFIQIPYLLKYIHMGGEYHHIHHMNSKIPGYNLQKYHEEVVSKSNMFDNVVKLSMTDCYNNLWLVLYDEDKKRYITFAEADEEIRKDKKM